MSSVFRDLIARFRHKRGGRAGYRMDSGVIDEVDLIDLENGACVPRVEVLEASPEEQEHLLDVCPPKLEQKLSLTRKHEQIRNPNDGGNVLVTLGHDQVVPVRKRIDVVSSDTIKRVRDITKNLEPVMRVTTEEGPESVHTTDHASASKDELDSYETREINNAFHFLAELDDAGDLDEEMDDSIEMGNTDFASSASSTISASGPITKPDKNNDPYPTSSADDSVRIGYPLEPTCFIQDGKGLHSMEAIDNGEYVNEAYESSPPNKVNPQNGLTRPVSINFKLGIPGLRGARDSFKRLRSFTCSGTRMDLPKVSHSKMSSDQLSWNEGAACLRKQARDFGKNSEEEVHEFGSEEYVCEPSTSDGTITAGHSVTSLDIAVRDSADCSSEGSEVDWSWVEEVECAGDSEARLQEEEQHQDQEQCRRSQRHKRLVEGTPSLVLVDSGSTRRRDSTLDARDTNGSVAMSVAAAGKSPSLGSAGPPECPPRNSSRSDAVAEGNGGHPRHEPSSSSGTNSWLRASMRRLRHLRLPEATQNRPSVSAPNSLPDIALIAPEILAAQSNDTSGVLLRPSSAPTRTASATETPAVTPRRGRGTAGRTQGRSQERQRQSTASGSRANLSDATTCSTNSTAGSSSGTSSSCSSTAASPQHPPNSPTSRRWCERQRDGDRDDERGEDEDEDENPLGRWPHALSPALACLGCTLGLFNISRFAILSLQFGANFIVQFLVLSLIVGIPLMTLQVCLGQRLAAGAVDMWKISPLFQGVGIALLAAQAFIGIYSIVGVSWMFVYFRDSFITKQDRYRWAEPFLLYRDDTKPANNSTIYKLHETVPDYFSGAVLQRHHLNEPDPGVVTLKFQVAFNLAVVWMIVFVSLSKGLRSYGKVVYVFTLIPIFGTLILCTKLLGLTPPGSIHQLFPATVWHEFFINGKSWVAASSEVFLTWGLLGAAAMQISAHNKHKHLLQRDTSLVIVLTFVVLLLAAFLANTCVQILKHHGYAYTTSSFERISGYSFMRLLGQQMPPGYGSTPERFMAHTSFLVGQRVTRPGADIKLESGYQVLRLSTELVPATLALLGTEQVSPFWAVLFYFILILFGIAQQLAIWHCVITGIMAINTKMMKLWETTITFFSCACAYVLGLPMATELGIYVVYYLDYTVGGAWWIVVLYLVQVGAVFAVRGRPHTGEAVVAELFPPSGRYLRHWAGPLLSFTWNVVLPITLMVLSITIFKSSGYRELYNYRRTNRDYWEIWARQLGAAIQLIPILLIPAVAVIQTCRYLNNGPPDIFDRIQLLYRPSLEPEERTAQTQLGGDGSTTVHGNGTVPGTTELPFEDPPPKYTPPPSYTTATGARIAKMLRQSIRRSVRRIANVLGEGSTPRTRPALQPPPPDYATVLVEMNRNALPSRDVTVNVTEPRPDVADTRRGSRTIDRLHRPSTADRWARGHHGTGAVTIDRMDVRSGNLGARSHAISGSSNLTAAEVANLLRSSIRRGTARTQQTLRRSFHNEEPRMTAASVENLVEAAAPIGQDSLVFAKPVSLVPQERDGNDAKKTADEMENSISVI